MIHFYLSFGDLEIFERLCFSVRYAHFLSLFTRFTRISVNIVTPTVLSCGVYTFTYIDIYRPRSFLEAGFRPLCPPFVYFVPLSRTKPAFWISTRIAPGPISQVLPGCRVRHPQYSKELFVWYRCEMHLFCRSWSYGLASVSRIDKIIGLFCKRALRNRRYSAKETCNLIDPTNRSHPIGLLRRSLFPPLFPPLEPWLFLVSLDTSLLRGKFFGVGFLGLCEMCLF